MAFFWISDACARFDKNCLAYYIALRYAEKEEYRSRLGPRPARSKFMSISRTVIVGAALMLITGGAALAAQASSQTTSTKSSNTANATGHEEMGTVSSLTSSELVLLNDKQKETTFKLDSSTKKEGTINKGAHVTVYYKNQNHERIATEIKVEAKKS